MIRNHIPYFFTLALSLLLLGACEDNNSGGSPCESDFSQPALFQNVADNLIIPGYEDLLLKLQSLGTEAGNFSANPSANRLAELREAWQSAYLSWQRVAQYELGPAEEQTLRNRLNSFPVDAAAVESKVAAGNTDFSDPDSFDKGFPALDYLLFGLGDTEEGIVQKLGSEDYSIFLAAVVEEMHSRVEATLAGWQDGGYRETFIENTGTAAGTSLSLIINNLNEHYEAIKRDKIGIPAGVTTLGITFPDKVEAFYSGISLALAQESLLASRLFFLGQASLAGQGVGLDDYLEEVKANKEGEALSTVIEAQFEKAMAALEAVQPPLSKAIEEDNETVIAAYNEITRQIVHIKTDMPSVLCVAITYIDNPSDSD